MQQGCLKANIIDSEGDEKLFLITAHGEASDGISEQVRKSLIAIKDSLVKDTGISSIHRDINNLVLTLESGNNQSEEDFATICVPVIMKFFNYNIPSLKIVVLPVVDQQEASKVSIQASGKFTCSESIKRFHVGPRFSESALYNKVLYISGQVPDDGTKDIVGQTAEVLKMIDDRLAEAGSDKSKILMAQVFLASMDDYAGMNVAWDNWVANNNAPPRATVQAPLAKSEWRIEIVVTAAI